MNTRIYRIIVLVGSLAIGILSGVSWTASAGSSSDSTTENVVATVTEKDIAYTPEELVVHLGQTIQIENHDPFDHKSRVTQQLENGGLGHIAVKDHLDKPGSRFSFKLKKAGRYEIRCMLHDGMTATIIAVK
ncbi:MAG: hypothetical protein D6698_04920 [Gammaproteobacteria bacterium]|nr:MAG: hypothetical protein D6698_04920 [Gammaproteobacteria bacterium]